MTLSFAWATNANYSTGPDTGFPTKVNPASTANGFINGTIAAAQHINFLFDAVGDELAKAVDGIGGGTYAMLEPINFTGDDITVGTGARILVQSTARLVIEGPDAELTVDPFGTLFVDEDGDLQIDGHFTMTATANAIIDGVFRMNTGALLTIDDDADSWLLTLTPQSQSFDSGTLAPTWLPLPSAAGWFQHEVATAVQIRFPINLPPGDDIVSVTVRVNGAGAGGGHASLPAGGDRLKVSLVAVDATGVAAVLASRADQSPDVATYDTNHIITLASGSLDSGSLPRTTNAVTRYYIVIDGETGANAVADTTALTSIGGTCTARAYRSDTMVY